MSKDNHFAAATSVPPPEKEYTCADHPDWEESTDYIKFMQKTHRQVPCGECNLWKIWEPK